MSTQEIMRLVSDYVSEYPNDTCGAKELAALESAIESLTAERDALRDAARLALDALSEYGNPYNWDEDFHGIRRKWQEPKSNTPSAYNGFELAQPAIAALKAVL